MYIVLLWIGWAGVALSVWAGGIWQKIGFTVLGAVVLGALVSITLSVNNLELKAKKE